MAKQMSEGQLEAAKEDSVESKEIELHSLTKLLSGPPPGILTAKDLLLLALLLAWTVGRLQQRCAELLV